MKIKNIILFFLYPNGWNIITNEANDTLHVQLLQGLTINDVSYPWGRIYNNQSYISIGISKNETTGWDYAPDLGQEISYKETDTVLNNTIVKQRTVIGYNYGIENSRFPNNTISQLLSQAVFNEGQYITLRLYTGGSSRLDALNQFNRLISNLKINN